MVVSTVTSWTKQLNIGPWLSRQQLGKFCFLVQSLLYRSFTLRWAIFRMRALLKSCFCSGFFCFAPANMLGKYTTAKHPSCGQVWILLIQKHLSTKCAPSMDNVIVAVIWLITSEPPALPAIGLKGCTPRAMCCATCRSSPDNNVSRHQRSFTNGCLSNVQLRMCLLCAMFWDDRLLLVWGCQAIVCLQLTWRGLHPSWYRTRMTGAKKLPPHTLWYCFVVSQQPVSLMRECVSRSVLYISCVSSSAYANPHLACGRTCALGSQRNPGNKDLQAGLERACRNADNQPAASEFLGSIVISSMSPDTSHAMIIAQKFASIRLFLNGKDWIISIESFH